MSRPGRDDCQSEGSGTTYAAGPAQEISGEREKLTSMTVQRGPWAASRVPRAGPAWLQFLRSQAEAIIAGRREILDRTLVWNQAHLRRVLAEYEDHYNRYRPYRTLR
jgi:hypothetical protein